MSKFISLVSIALFASLLAGCGGDSNDQPVAGTYAYTQGNGYYGGHSMCPAQVVQDWNLVADSCQQASGPGDRYCSSAVEAMMQRDAAFLQGPGCSVATSQVRWCPGNDWRSQQTFQLNAGILQSMLTQFGGPSSVPANGGYYGPYGQR